MRICYSAGIKSAKTNAYISLLSQFKNKKKFSGTIHWNQVTGASGYQIRYATNKKLQKMKKVLTKGVIECIIIKSSVERTKEHGKRSVRVEKKLKTFSKNF